MVSPVGTDPLRIRPLLVIAGVAVLGYPLERLARGEIDGQAYRRRRSVPEDRSQ